MTSRSRRGRRSAYAAVGLACAATIGITLGETASATPNRQAAPQHAAVAAGAQASDTLRIVAAEPTSGLDPNTALTQASLRVMELTYDTLLDYDRTGKLIPDLAKSWSVSKNGLTYTFNLRAAKFSDGSPITAADVVFSVKRMQQGAALQASLTDVKSVSAAGDTTVKIGLKSRSRVFLNALARVGNAAILSQKAVSADPSYFTKPTATSGPWQLTTWIPKDHLSLTANPSYWKAGFPKIKNVQYTFSADPTSAAAALDSGTADMYFPMAPTDAIRLQKAGKIKYFAPPSPGILIWGLDKTKPPFDDVRVRQAFAYMVPRDDRKTVCWNGTGGVSYGGVILPGSWAYTAGFSKYHVSKNVALANANKLLDAAGWKKSGSGRAAQGVKGVKDGTQLKVTVPFESNWEQARCNTQLLQNDLKPAGITIVPQAYDPAAFWGDVAKNKFTMYHGGDGWATVDDMMQQGFTTKGQANGIMSKWSNPQVDKLVRQAQATPDLGKAKQLYHQVQQIIETQVPTIITGAQYSIIGTTTKLNGFYGRADNSNRSLITATLS
jgi:peptide/nickel transport system substrate-binding protein